MYADPDKSFPQIADSWGALKAFYRFINNPKVTRDEILSSHVRQTIARCAAHSAVLVIQDTTTLSYQHHPKTEGLGHTGTRGSGLGYGMLVHNTCAIAADSHQPLGMLHQQVMVRNQVYPQDESYKDRLSRPRESDKWLNSARQVNEMLSETQYIIHVADREADIYFLMQEIIKAKHGFVIRQTRDRKTDAGLMATSIADTKDIGSMSVDIARNGSRKARTAHILLRSGAVLIYPPKVVGHVGEPLRVNIVVAKEDCSQKNLAALGWVLLTTEPVDTLQECALVVRHYQGRWTIEEFHKALKTGCKIEQRQLTTREGLENVLGMSSIIAMLLLNTKFLARQSDALLQTVLTPIQCKILEHQFPQIKPPFTNQQALRLIALLGGFLGRKSDGDPGWITLFRGYEKLLIMEMGYYLALKDVGKG